MVGGIFGKKDKKGAEEKEKEKTPAAVSPTSSAPDTGGGDLFGGMAARSRRTRGATTIGAPAEPEATPAEAAPPVAAEKPAEVVNEPKPFFSSFSVAQQGPIEEEEDPEEATLRRRLERFYEEHNPSKLAQIDQTIKQFKGKEEELFGALVKKYGPEPTELKKDTVKPAFAADSASASADAKREPSTASGGFQWGGNDAASADGASGWGAASEHSAAAGDQWGSGATGFTFGGADDATATTAAFQFASTEAPIGGFGFTEPTESPAGGFVFASATTETPSSGFGFASPAAAEESPSQGFGFASEEQVPPQQAEAPNSSSDEDDEPTLNERQRAELRDHQGDVLEGKQQLAAAIQCVADAIVRRQALLAQHTQVERDIDACIAKEEFERAEELNNQLIALASSISELDVTERDGESQIAGLVDRVKESVRALSSMYVRHRQELLDSKVDEERRVNKYITETTSRLDTQGEKIAASLDRANRTLHNTEQEVMNIEQRHQKIQEKIGEQTKGLRDKLSVTTAEKESLDAEIRDLEAKLQLKRRQSAEKKLQLAEFEEKLKIIMDDFTDTVNEVSKQLKDERGKRDQAQLVVDDFTQQEEVHIREQKRFHEDRDGMLSTLGINNNKIERYQVVAAELSADAPREVEEYVAASVREVLAARAPGRSVLVQNPSATADSGSPLAALKLLEEKGRQLALDLQENQAQEASLTVRLQDSRKSIPLLEAAKKAAAQAKQFKEAQAKTEEIKRLTEESNECEAGLQTAAVAIERLKEDIALTEVLIEKERKKAASSVAEFKNRYLGALASASKFREATQLNLLRLDADDTSGEDDLADACAALHHALTTEARTLPAGDEAPEESAVSTVESTAPVSDANTDVIDVVDEPVEELTAEELLALVAEAEGQQNDAIEQEKFELCDELELKIQALQARLAALA